MSMPRSAIHRSRKIYHLTMTAVMAAVICVLSPLVIPIGPVPITLANLAMYLSLYLLGGKRGTASCLVYVLIGMAGVPVFAGFTGGAAKLFGPTGGYIVGYLLMVMIAGRSWIGRKAGGCTVWEWCWVLRSATLWGRCGTASAWIPPWRLPWLCV